MASKSIYIALGSNLGDSVAHIRRALRELDRLPTCRVRDVSSLYVSSPVGCPCDAGDFVNAVAYLRTGLTPMNLLRALQRIERDHDRRTTARNAPRTLDLDLLLYGALRRRTILLSIPHPRLLTRAFVLHPLVEIDAKVRVPGIGCASRYVSATRGQRIVRLGSVETWINPGETWKATRGRPSRSHR
jgi:2-amino-4-hydroxy-6-hydroxymethyldihydropteridine diphosphokinase